MSGPTKFQQTTEDFIRALRWSDQASDEEKTLVAGNIRNFAASIAEPEITRLRDALGACERYALRMQHDAGHPLDNENAKAIARVAREARGQRL